MRFYAFFPCGFLAGGLEIKRRDSAHLRSLRIQGIDFSVPLAFTLKSS
jgi:hypothetical protein